MSKSWHTEGPYHPTPAHRLRHGEALRVTDDRKRVLATIEGDSNRKEVKDNASLFAASPALAEAWKLTPAPVRAAILQSLRNSPKGWAARSIEIWESLAP